MASAIHFTDEAFKKALDNGGVMLVDFWATWCGPCRMLAPVIEQLAEEFDGKVVVGKVDTDEYPDLAQEYGIMSIPNVIIFKDGQIFDRKVGVMPKAVFVEALQDALA